MLPWQYRLYFWGVHGVFAEVVFTGIWEFIVTGDWTLKGCSSLWSFITYGIGTLCTELMHYHLLSRRTPLLLRCIVYVLVVYAWELSFGAILSYFDACPWDYSHFDYDVMGLVTLEYAPFWFLAGLYFEYIMSAMKSLEEVPRWKQAL